MKRSHDDDDGGDDGDDDKKDKGQRKKLAESFRRISFRKLGSSIGSAIGGALLLTAGVAKSALGLLASGMQNAVAQPVPVCRIAKAMENDKNANLVALGAVARYRAARSIAVDNESVAETEACMDELHDIVVSVYQQHQKFGVTVPAPRLLETHVMKNRAVIVKWIVRVVDHMQDTAPQPEVLFMTVNLIDRMLQKHRGSAQFGGCNQDSQRNLVALAVAAFFLADLYVESVNLTLILDEFLQKFGLDKTSGTLIRKISLQICNDLEHQFCEPNLWHFQHYMLPLDTSVQIVMMTGHLLRLCLLENQLYEYAPLLVCAACIAEARVLCGLSAWQEILSIRSTYGPGQNYCTNVNIQDIILLVHDMYTRLPLENLDNTSLLPNPLPPTTPQTLKGPVGAPPPPPPKGPFTPQGAPAGGDPLPHNP